MENVCPEGTEHQSVRSPSGEALVKNIHVKHWNVLETFHSGMLQDSGLLESGIVTMLQVYYIWSNIWFLMEI